MAVNSQITLTDRDEAILTDLYFTRILSTEQITAKYFKKYNTAKRRLFDLKEMGMIARRNPYRGMTIWMITRRSFDREIEALHREGERYRDWPKPRFIPHLLDTNDVFIDISEEMDEVLGEHPEWEWKDEPHAREAFKDGEGKCVHRPDAEISFGLAPRRRTLEHWERQALGRRFGCQEQHRNIHQSSRRRLYACTAPRIDRSPR